MRKISIDHHFREFPYSSYEGMMVLPEGVDPNRVHAKFHNGVLQITRPTSAAMVPKGIEMEADTPALTERLSRRRVGRLPGRLSKAGGFMTHQPFLRDWA